jgi:chaperonin GroES
MSFEIRPLGNHVLIGPIPPSEIIAQPPQNRIIVPDSCEDPRKHKQFRVLAVGPGKLLKNGQRLAPEVAVGDYVMFSGDFDHKELEDGRKLVNADQLLAKWSAMPDQ